MKIFNQTRWNMLSDELKVAVACRYCAIPYFSNLVVQTGMDKYKVHSAINRLTDLGKLKEHWQAVDHRWVKVFRYDNHIDNDFIDKVIEELA